MRQPSARPAGHGDEITADELAALLGTDDEPALVDVREPDEFSAWAIGGARNVPLGELAAQLGALDTDREVVVICASGNRSARAAGALRSRGIPAANLVGGMQAWSAVCDVAEIELGDLDVVQVRRRGKGCLSYVVGAAGEAFVVDPSFDTARYVDVASARGWRISRVFDTHLHADHVSGARSLAGSVGAALHLSPADPFGFTFDPVAGGETFALGGSAVRVIGAPGHTMGSLVLDVAGRAILSGDTLFVDGVGRPDLADRAEEFASALHASLQSLLVALSEDVLVLPAHYGDAVRVVPSEPVVARLADLRAALPQLSWGRDEFVSWAAGRCGPRPPRYDEIVRVNMGEVSVGTDECRSLELGPNRCAAT